MENDIEPDTRKCFWCKEIIKFEKDDKPIEDFHLLCFLQMSDWCWKNVDPTLKIISKHKGFST